MKHQKSFLLALVVGVAAGYGDDTISGRVVINGTTTPLANVRVWLKNAPAIWDSTGTDGRFYLITPSTAVAPRYASGREARSFTVQNNRLEFSLAAPQKISCGLYTVQGSRAAAVFEGMGVQGKNSVALGRIASSLASGVYVLKITGSDIAGQALLAIAGGRMFADPPSGAVQTRTGGAVTAKLAVTDSLIVLRMGYEIKKRLLSNVTTVNVGDVPLVGRTYRLGATVTVKTGRTIEVIMPSDYTELYSLPVLYLLHGGGEDHTAWRVKGLLIDTLNRFLKKDSMAAMIIVTPDAASRTNYGNYGKTGDVFYTDLTVDIRNYMESHYKVDTSRFARAISGFSMGAMQTHNLTLFYPKLFGYAFSICGGLYTCSGFSETRMRADIADGTIDTSAVNSMRRYRLYSNPTDIAYTNGDTPYFEMFLGTVGIRHTYDFTSYSIGGHTYSYCNVVFQKYAVMIFK
jgi:pimeloyl-ACP methyl ester carboxylesterase